MPVTLARECIGAPRSGAYKNVIRRMNAGRMPTEQQDREEEKAADRTAKPWEQIDASSTGKRKPCRGNGMLEQEKEAMEYRLAIKRRKLMTASNPQQGTVQHVKRVRQQAGETVVSKRRRITDKKAVETEACAILAAGNWIHRIRHRAEKCIAECTHCGSQTKTKCRVCARPLCIACAKAKAPCSVTAKPQGKGDILAASRAKDTG